MNGRGIYLWKDGRKYEGCYLNDKKHGYGIYIWPDGRVYLVFNSRNMRDIGIMENNLEKVDMYYKMEGVNWDFGKMGKELNGLTNQNKILI